LRARALEGAGWLASFQGDSGAAKALVEEELALYRQLVDEEGIASGLTNLGMTAMLGQRDDIPLPAVMEELGELTPRLENRNTLAYLLMLEGIVAASRGDLERSVTLHEESLELFREIPKPQGIVSCLAQLGGLALIRGDYEGTLPLLRESLRLGWEADYKAALSSPSTVWRARRLPGSNRYAPSGCGGSWKAWRRLTACISRPWVSLYSTTRTT
jgi:hypothetical protein